MVNLQKLNTYTAKAGMDDKDVAQALGISPSLYSKKKCGEREFTGQQIIEMTKLLKVPLSDVRATFLVM